MHQKFHAEDIGHDRGRDLGPAEVHGAFQSPLAPCLEGRLGGFRDPDFGRSARRVRHHRATGHAERAYRAEQVLHEVVDVVLGARSP